MQRLLVPAAIVVTAAACASPVATRASSPGPTVSVPASPQAAPAPVACDQASGGSKDAAMLLTQVKAAPFEGRDRVVLTFTAREGREAKTPWWQIAQVKPPLTEDASGKQVSVKGDSFARLTVWASGVDLSGATAHPAYNGPKSITPTDTSLVKEVRNAGDFENVLTYYIGTAPPGCWNVFALHDPERIVIDMAPKL